VAGTVCAPAPSRLAARAASTGMDHMAEAGRIEGSTATAGRLRTRDEVRAGRREATESRLWARGPSLITFHRSGRRWCRGQLGLLGGSREDAPVGSEMESSEGGWDRLAPRGARRESHFASAIHRRGYGEPSGVAPRWCAVQPSSWVWPPSRSGRPGRRWDCFGSEGIDAMPIRPRATRADVA
jgi:hypothetical protein